MDAEDRFPHRVREIEHSWITLPDGTRLGARIWLPQDAEAHPVPAILEYLPYHKRDFTVFRDRPIQAYMAGHGYAAVRVDIRGTGDSDGILLDEYTKQEQDDALAVIAWLREQAWCDGNVGMWGISWGGFNSLQVAARRPEGLKAVMALGFTDDRFATDVHYLGGLMLAENPFWAAAMLSTMSLPPDPALYGDGWRDAWAKRLDASPPWMEPWALHQRRDAYWKHGSVCEDYSAIACPVFAVTGWEDGYVEPVFRLMENLTVPRKALIGPWAHTFPQSGQPLPAIGFLQECVRWWDQWLKGRDTGIMDEPRMRLWMQDSVRPQRTYEERPGRWVAEDAWPGSSQVRTLYLTSKGLRDTAGSGSAIVRSPLATGECAGRLAGYGGGPDMPSDQRADDGRSLVFESAPLGEDLEILGAAEIALTLTSDKPQAMIAVRLNEVRPDGTVTRVSFGVRNLAHRDGSEAPQPLEPGKPYRLRVAMKPVAHSFARGNRLRVAISTSYWPIVWPSPQTPSLALDLSDAKLDLPVRVPRDADAKLHEYGPPEAARPEAITVLAPDLTTRTLEIDEMTEHRKLTMVGDYGLQRVDSYDLTAGLYSSESTEITGEDPASARTTAEWTASLSRGDWHIETKARLSLRCDAENFHYEASLDAFEGGKPFRQLTWRKSFPRDNM
ncbi:MAG: CocE/NonD family hydrolase [Rhizomicrobium sp.]